MGRCINSIGFCVGWSYFASPDPPMMNLGEGESQTVEFSPALPNQGAFFFRTYQRRETNCALEVSCPSICPRKKSFIVYGSGLFFLRILRRQRRSCDPWPYSRPRPASIRQVVPQTVLLLELVPRANRTEARQAPKPRSTIRPAV